MQLVPFAGAAGVYLAALLGDQPCFEMTADAGFKLLLNHMRKHPGALPLSF